MNYKKYIVVAVLIIVGIASGIFGYSLTKDKNAPYIEKGDLIFEVTESEEDEDSTVSTTEATTTQTTTETATETTTETTSNTTTEATDYITDELTTYKPTTYNKPTNQETADPTDIHQGGFFIVRDTPASAGLVIRRSDSSESEQVGILQENDIVRAVSDYSSLDNGYTYIETLTGLRGMVLARYLHPYNPYENDSRPYSDYIKNINVRVSYDTPDNLGLNLRREASSSSELLCVVEEGAVLKVLEDYSPDNNGYIYVGYDHPHAGNYYTGWVLIKYMEYYGV